MKNNCTKGFPIIILCCTLILIISVTIVYYLVFDQDNLNQNFNYTFKFDDSNRNILIKYTKKSKRISDIERKTILEHDLSYLALCTIVKDEVDIVDWIKYHVYIGFKKIYVYDHGSQPPLLELLLPFIQEQVVSYKYFIEEWQTDDFMLTKIGNGAHFNSAQRWAYTQCVVQNRHRHQFIGLIDIDEYVIIWDDQHVVQSDAVSFFKGFENYGAVQLHWRIFGSSGHIEKPIVSPLIAYTQCGEDEQHPQHLNMFTKTFVNTRYFSGWCDPHFCGVEQGLVNALKQRTNWNNQNITFEKALLHHYYIKSREDYELKMQRGFVHTTTKKHTWEKFEQINNETLGHCNYTQQIAHECCA
eukprot:TRINITY_DN1870_c0_g1_i10.p1 TRINITY_DN1870_c0_g1~~TRINITY_DN1870_c0_g1_i10.p1  ORF type:complete len:392 (+),score=17.95 TRINITY_DN1870_c0_g1_i10:107-1177(+)